MLTVLDVLLYVGKHKAIAMLLNAGAYLNLGNRSGQTPLIKATKAGHLEAVRVLLSRYADVDTRGKVSLQ